MTQPPSFSVNEVLTSADMNLIVKFLVPTGSVSAFAGSSAPTNWLLCDGSNVSRTTYSDLFAVIGTTFGAGDGSTTFGLPNLKGKVPVGKDSSQTEFDTLAETGGAKTHTLTAAEQASLPIYYGTPSPADQYRVGAGGALGGYVGPGVSSVNNGFGSLTALGGGGAHNNLQPYLVLNFIIKT